MSNVATHAVEAVPAHGHDAHGHDDHEHGHHGPAHLHHHFTDASQQRESNALGMWVFLVTEVMTFGVLFFVYTLYRHIFEGIAHEQRYLAPWGLASYLSPWGVGSHMLNNSLGFFNTLVLLSSSLTVASSVHYAGVKNKKLLLTWLCVTWVLGATFLGVKAVEWTADYHEGIVPGLNWHPAESLAHKGFLAANVEGVNGEAYVPAPAPPAQQWQAIYDSAKEGGESEGGHEPKFQGIVNTMHLQMFFVIYFCMTGLHAIHMIIGLVLLAIYIRHARANIFTASSNDQPVEIFGLYWHFVDIVWIFLYPLLYLITLPVQH